MRIARPASCVAALLLAASAFAQLAFAQPAFAQPALAQQAPPAGDPVVAQRGAIALTQSAVREMVRNSDPDTRHALETDPAALARAVRDRILQLSVLAEAHAKQYDARPDVAWRADRAREQSITDGYVASLTQPDAAYPSDDDIQAAYEANKARLMLPRQYHLAQLFIAVPGTDAAADAEAQRRIADLRTQITAKKADFAVLAKRNSDDRASAANGGDLGWLREDQVVPAVRAVAAGLAEGALSDPVRAPDGWHLLRLLGTRAAGPAPLAEVHDALVRALRQQKQQEAARGYVNDLLKAQPIQLNEIELARLAPK